MAVTIPGFTFSPSSLAMAAYSIIDDRDSPVASTGSWFRGGTSLEYKNTTSSSRNVGDQLSILFHGSAIAVYGTSDSTSGGVQTQYAIDGAPGTIITSPASDTNHYQELFWQSNIVSSGTHTLVVTIVSANPPAGEGQGTIWFDYFNVSLATSTSTSSSIASTTPASPANNVVGSKTPSHTGLIAGIVGTFVAVIVILFVGLFFRRLRRKKMNNDSRKVREPSQYADEPQPIFPTSLSMTTKSAGSKSSASLSSAYPGVSPHPLMSTAFETEYDPQNSIRDISGSSPSGIKQIESGSFADRKRRRQLIAYTGHPVPTQHVDSGARGLDPESSVSSELPPVYTCD